MIMSVYLIISGILLVCIVSLRQYAAGKLCTSKAILTNKTVIITGANNGIGKEVAVDLARRKARVILACRNREKGEQAAVEVRERSGNGKVLYMQLDLASLDSIQNFVSNFLEREPCLDILINNARANSDTSNGTTRTKDGFEVKMGVNHLGHFLLTNLLLEKMKDCPSSSRIIVVSSDAYKCCPSFDFDNMNNNDPARYQRKHNDAYRQSKLANVLFVRELAKRLRGTSVSVNAVHPGTVTTQALREFIGTFPLILRPLLYVLSYLFFKTPQQGAQTIIHCAVAQEVEGVSGKYFVDCQPRDLTTAAATDDRAAEKLWEGSSQLVELS